MLTKRIALHISILALISIGTLVIAPGTSQAQAGESYFYHD